MRIDTLLEQGDGIIRLRDHAEERSTVQRAARAGIVTGLLPGVYAATERAASPAIRLRAACAWAPTGVIHGRTAAELYLRRPVTMPICLRADFHGTSPAAWLQVSRGTAPEWLTGGGIRVVTAAHCAAELAAVDGGETLVGMLRHRLCTPDQLAAAAAGFRATAGNRRRARLLAAALDNPWSIGELRLHELLRGAGITGWVANRPVRVCGRIVLPDVWFRRHRLVLEFDGESVHSGHDAFEADRHRQNLLVLGGYRVLRVTWEMVTRHPDRVIELVRAALRQTS